MKFKQYLLEQDDFDWDVTSDEFGSYTSVINYDRIRRIN